MSSAEKLRVVFTGHAGLAKKTVLDRLCKYIYAQDPRWREATEGDRPRIQKRLAQSYDAEARLKPMETFLELPWRTQQGNWRRSVSEAVARFKAEAPDFAFLSLHLSYQWRSGFFSPFSWRIPVHRGMTEEMEDSLLYLVGEEFQPDYLVTLIDDVHAVQQRIAPGFHIRLRQLFTWRTVETLLTDILAKETAIKRHPNANPVDFPFERCPVVAVRHPPEMLYRLLIQSDVVRIYASYPMSRTRERHRGEIDRFRSLLHQHFAVFDPVTIDERPLQQILSAPSKGKRRRRTSSRRLILSAHARWPIPADRTLCGDGPLDFNNLMRDEIEEVATSPAGTKTEIDRTIEMRDFRLIDQADCLVVYRPQFKRDKFSGGTEAEMWYAKDTGKPIFLIHDRIADGPLAPETFDLEFISGPDLFDAVGNLGDPTNQERVINSLIKRLKTRVPPLALKRLTNPT